MNEDVKQAVKEDRRRIRQAIEAAWREGITKEELMAAIFGPSTPPAESKSKWVDLSR